ncbi:hypothetical protein WICPIJ_003061 [Wickerhamomyces pijperi]|uniref:Uncharacterized protein n=1 Tax=Wickerhamomyces pijperi TaxID=599730 RepID=A0A9P8TNC6_WICPI|nr:hypothetical protein WICPIJ_003061 [Wickerhamomyces pijperi]
MFFNKVQLVDDLSLEQFLVLSPSGELVQETKLINTANLLFNGFGLRDTSSSETLGVLVTTFCNTTDIV